MGGGGRGSPQPTRLSSASHLEGALFTGRERTGPGRGGEGTQRERGLGEGAGEERR